MSADGPGVPTELPELVERVGAVVDPEIPVLTIADLGILRGVRSGEDGRVVVDITPTYSGCPALDAIAADVRRVLAEAGHPDAEVRTVLHPAWTTDWITPAGRRALAAYGIAPPGPARSGGGPVPLTLERRAPQQSGGGPGALGGLAPGEVSCPHCGSPDTRESSRFGSTACKSLWVCRACREPFDAVKPL